MNIRLPELKYYPDFILKVYFTQRVWYLIPFDIILDDRRDLIYGKYYETSYGYYVYGRSITGWLLTLTDYTDELYFRRFILNIVSNEVLRCPFCNKPLKFISISKGYRLNCDTNLCQYKLINLNRDQNSFKLNTVQSQAKGRSTQFKNKGNLSDLCAFYLNFTSDYTSYKYGITANYIYERSRLFYSNNICYHILITNTRDNIADLEELVKLGMNQISETFGSDKINLFKEVFRNSVRKLNLVNLFNKLDFI